MMDYFLTVYKIIDCFYKLRKKDSIIDMKMDIEILSQSIMLLQQEIKEIQNFHKNKLLSEIPYILCSVKDLYKPSIAQYSINNILDSANKLINYKIYSEYLSSQDINSCICIGHWSRYMIFSELKDINSAKMEIKEAFELDVKIASELFPFVLTDLDKKELKKITSHQYFSSRIEDIQNILLEEKLLELKNVILQNINDRL